MFLFVVHVGMCHLTHLPSVVWENVVTSCMCVFTLFPPPSHHLSPPHTLFPPPSHHLSPPHTHARVLTSLVLPLPLLLLQEQVPHPLLLRPLLARPLLLPLPSSPRATPAHRQLNQSLIVVTCWLPSTRDWI